VKSPLTAAQRKRVAVDEQEIVATVQVIVDHSRSGVEDAAPTRSDAAAFVGNVLYLLKRGQGLDAVRVEAFAVVDVRDHRVRIVDEDGS
jgi:hypothetical protein